MAIVVRDRRSNPPGPNFTSADGISFRVPQASQRVIRATASCMSAADCA
jgi:hypothetical protein